MASRLVNFSTILLMGMTLLGTAGADGTNPVSCTDVPGGFVCEVASVTVTCVQDAGGTTCEVSEPSVGTASCSHGPGGTGCRGCPDPSRINEGVLTYVQNCLKTPKPKIWFD